MMSARPAGPGRREPDSGGMSGRGRSAENDPPGLVQLGALHRQVLARAR